MVISSHSFQECFWNCLSFHGVEHICKKRLLKLPFGLQSAGMSTFRRSKFLSVPSLLRLFLSLVPFLLSWSLLLMLMATQWYLIFIYWSWLPRLRFLLLRLSYHIHRAYNDDRVFSYYCNSFTGFSWSNLLYVKHFLMFPYFIPTLYIFSPYFHIH